MKDSKLNILVVDSGARGHVLGWKLGQSRRTKKLYFAPGNTGTAQIGENLPIGATEIQALGKAAKEKGIDLVVVGQETPLTEGITDYFKGFGIPIFGPTKAAAILEASKIFSHELMEKHDIPCAKGRGFCTFAGAMAYLQKQEMPIVIKADGLAAGKGVVIAHTIQEAETALQDFMIERKLKEAGERVLVSEYLTGKEVSVFAATNGEIVVRMGVACDYKPIYDGDKGPMTGGMGSYSPPGFLTEALLQKIDETIFYPVVKAMRLEGRTYQGILYGGLIITSEGPKVLEFNIRPGDPESQVLLPRLKTDLVEIILSILNNTLDQIKIEWSTEACVGVVMASPGYPDKPKNGFPISGLNKLDSDILVFHAGTKAGKKQGEVLTTGGRVLTVVATGRNITEAQKKVYANVPKIKFEGGCQFRRDIANRL